MPFLKGPISRHILNANIFSFLLISKFALLVVYGWILPGDTDFLGNYTLFLGLTNSFYILAGMRARVFVLQAISHKNDLLVLCLIIAILGIVMTTIVIWLNLSDGMLTLILLVAGTKFLEMFMDAFTSFSQKTQGRQVAFTIINQHAFLLVVAYLVLIPFGLNYAIAAECLLLVVAVIRQIKCINLSPTDLSPPALSAYVKTARTGLAFTLTATMNAAQFTYFVYYGRATFDVAAFLFIAKLLAVQSILSRILTSNNFYFKDDIAIYENRIERITLVMAVAGLAGAIVTVVFISPEVADLGSVDLVMIGVSFSLVNIVNIFLRQHILMMDGPRKLAGLHAIELVLIYAVTYMFDMSVAQALVAFTTLRFARVIVLMQPALFPRAS